jgi:glucose-1-phosphate thymidylyltransferase
MQVFILAGGFATRLWPLTEKRAKPLLPLAGKPILTHLVEKIPAGLPVTVSTNAAFAEDFRRWKDTIQGRDVTVVVEHTKSDDEKLGALGATAQWIEDASIADDLLLLTGDNYLGFSLADFLASFESEALLAAHDLGDPSRASSFGTVMIEGKPAYGKKNTIRGFEEKPAHPKSSLISTGCIALPARLLPVLATFAKTHPDNVGSVFEEFLRRGESVECIPYADPWLDIGSFASYLEAHRLVTGSRTVIHPTAKVVDSRLTGSVAIGAGSIVEKSELTDCVVFEGSVIRDCVLKDCVIDDQCTVSGVDLKGKMLRAGTVLHMKNPS